MKLHHFVLCALALIPISSSFVSAIDTTPVNASEQTNRLWEQYFGGRKIVSFSRYTSGNGGGGMSSTSEFHFCKNGNYIYGSQSSIAVHAGNMSANSNSKDDNTGTWKVLGSNSQKVLMELTDSDGTNKRQSVYTMGTDKRLYGSSGKKLLTGPSQTC